MNKALLTLILLAFGALTAFALWHHGGLGAFLLFFTRDPASWQVFADLLITMVLLLVFIRRDALATGRPFWPWAAFSMTCGSFGPLLYFLSAKKRS
ncbi:MAG: DUF2834 domain-containing protein [Brachymonas sp.]|nr:DUF2834 domain-containing protein [Brachymonas sp.]